MLVKYCWPILALCVWLSAGTSYAAPDANGHYSVKVWEARDKLPQSAVLALTQTRDGYLWVGTLNGLARFDGVRFTRYYEGNTPELTSNHILKLFEDSKGNLWIGTESAGIFVVKDGKVKKVDIGHGSRPGRLVSICEDSQGAVWLYTKEGQLCRYFNNRGDIWNAGAGFTSRSRALVPEGDWLWVGTDVSLAALGPINSVGSVGLPVAREIPVRRLDFLAPSSHGGFWRLADGRIQKWNRDRCERDLCAYPWSDNFVVTAACEDPEGNLIVGTYGDGVYWFDAEGKFTHLTTQLSNSSILSLYVDREGCLWVGTNGGGLDRVKRELFDVLPDSRGLTVSSVCEDARGGLWIGYNRERVDYWDGKNVRQFTNLLGNARAFLPKEWQLYVHSVLVDRAQQVWVGISGLQGSAAAVSGLFQWKDNQFRPVPGSERVPQDISVLFQDHSNRIWAGTQAGLACYDGSQWNVYTTADGLGADTIRAIAEDAAGDLWIGTEGGGLSRFHQGKFERFERSPSGLPSGNVLSLYAEPDNTLWVGTASGLARFKNNKWTTFAESLGLDNSVDYILDDGRGELWLGTDGGLMRVPKKKLSELADDASKTPAEGLAKLATIRSYGEPDGLPTSECSQGSQPAACRAQDGKLWFATIKGLVCLDPRRLHTNTNPPPVMIESVFIDGEPASSGALRAPPLHEAVVPAGKESLEINYTALNLSAPEEGKFEYRLENHESIWTVRPGSVRYARYSKLPPGNYVFHVRACNEDGVWNEVGASLAVHVLPPFWRTWWFLSAATLGLLGAIVGSVHYVSTQKLHRQLAILRQHEALEKERARIARDLHDQLGANLTQVALLGELAEADKELPEEVEAHAKQISQTARDTTHALDEIVWTVNPSNDTLDGLVNYVCKYAQEYFALAGLRYRLEVPPQLPQTPISPEVRHNVFLAAKEAVNNVVKHSQATSAWLRLQLEPSRFTLEIEDNGKGLPEDAANKGRNGLRNMRKRLEEVGGAFELVRGAEGGTNVKLTAPLQRANSTPG